MPTPAANKNVFSLFDRDTSRRRRVVVVVFVATTFATAALVRVYVNAFYRDDVFGNFKMNTLWLLRATRVSPAYPAPSFLCTIARARGAQIRAGLFRQRVGFENEHISSLTKSISEGEGGSWIYIYTSHDYICCPYTLRRDSFCHTMWTYLYIVRLLASRLAVLFWSMHV